MRRRRICPAGAVVSLGMACLVAASCGAETDPANGTPDPGPIYPGVTDPFADAVVSFVPGPEATFGHNELPGIVLGAPRGNGAAGGSLDVASFGDGGVMVLELTDLGIIDGDGPDLLIFENPFSGWAETAYVSASEDGQTWYDWPCDPADEPGGYPGCAGVNAVFAHADGDVDPTDPIAAGGDAFDLADLGITRARYVRIEDTGANNYGFASGGFDLDALAVVHWEELTN